MRLLCISNHAEMIGGGEHSFVDLLSHLPAAWEPFAVVPEKGNMWSRLAGRNIPAGVVPLPAIRPWHAHEMLRSLKALADLCRMRSPSLFYANGSRAAFYGGIVGRLLRIPVVWHCRIADRDPYLDPLLAALSTCIVANSRATAKRFARPARRKVRVVYNGVDLDWLRQKGINKPELVGTDWKVILMVARASRSKRHDLALSAFERVAATEPHAHLTCVGSRDDLEIDWWQHLMERSRRSPFSNRIHWVGHAEDIRPWYKAAQLMLFPCQNEGFGRVLVEAMACGVPVVAARSGGVPEIVSHDLDGLLINTGNVSEMADAIQAILQDGLFRKRLAESAVERARFFGMERHMTEIIGIFESMIAPTERSG